MTERRSVTAVNGPARAGVAAVAGRIEPAFTREIAIAFLRMPRGLR